MKLPDLNDLIQLRSVVHGLTLHGRRVARAQLFGTHVSVHRGRGLEFEEVRPYTVGDDPRSIDWRVTARRGKPHTKMFREERERPVWLLVDLQPSMFFGSRTQLKSMVALRAAAILAWIAAVDGDRIGALVTDGQTKRVLPPRAREAGVLTLLATLNDMQPRRPSATAAEPMSAALQTLAPLVRPGSMVLAVSDFTALDASSDALWTKLATHSQCNWYWVTDPLEAQGLPGGQFRAGVPGRLWTFDGARTRERWQRQWREREQRVAMLAQRCNVELTQLDTRIDVARNLRDLLQVRDVGASRSIKQAG